MKKEEALKTAVLFRTLYQTLKGCAEGKDERYEGFKYIPLNISFAPSLEQIKGLSSYILENEDRRLYESTFGMIDIDFLNSVYRKLDEAQWGWDKEIRYNLSIGNKAEVRELSGDDFLYIVEVYDLWGEIGAILREARLLQPIFKNLIPQPDTSTTVITEMVIDTSTGATGTAPEGLRLPVGTDTPEARKYLSRCIEEGWLTITSTGGEWKKAAIQLGYVCSKIYPQPRPLTALIKFFNNPNLKAQITTAEVYDFKTRKTQQWKTEIDSKIFYD